MVGCPISLRDEARFQHSPASSHAHHHLLQGHAPAQFQYGLCLKEGEGVPRDLSEAVRYFMMVIEQGHTEAHSVPEVIR